MAHPLLTSGQAGIEEAAVSKEKFEVAFLAGGLMLNALGTRLRRKATTLSEEVGVAMHAVRTRLDEHRDALADPDAAERTLARLRAELCESRPNRAKMTAYVNRLRAQAPSNVAVGEAVTALDDAIEVWLGSARTE